MHSSSDRTGGICHHQHVRAGIRCCQRSFAQAARRACDTAGHGKIAPVLQSRSASRTQPQPHMAVHACTMSCSQHSFATRWLTVAACLRWQATAKCTPASPRLLDSLRAQDYKLTDQLPAAPFGSTWSSAAADLGVACSEVQRFRGTPSFSVDPRAHTSDTSVRAQSEQPELRIT